PVAVGVHRPHVAAVEVQEAMELALGVMEAPGARPAVGAAEDTPAAVEVVDPTQLPRHPVDGGRPAHGHERLAPTAAVGPGPAVEPPGADHRLGDPGRVPEATRDVLKERRRIGILRPGTDGDDRAILDLRLEGAPV